ncbi:MAG: hypothetical protein FWH17_10450 [Oscillospiraceae bacterium]|nr:hypothetical protein [Oscillospiraceae bacterium]
MAKLEFDGLVDFGLDIQKMIDMPAHVIDDMLNAAADVLVDAQKASGHKMGVYDKGSDEAHMIDSIKKGKPGGGSIYIRPSGHKKGRHGRSNQAIAFLNEYGTSTQHARPFVRTANEDSADAAIDAAEAVYDAWLNS